MNDSGLSFDFTRREGTALVVGASGGLGRAIAHTLLDRGSRLAATYRTPGSTAIAELLARAPQTRSYQLNLSNADASKDTIAAVVSDLGGIHTLVYAAGPHVPMVHLSQIHPDQYRHQLLEDAAAYFNIVHHALPHLRASKGNIVAVTTAATRRFPVRDGLSAAPKSAIEATTWGLAAEEGRFGVRANCVGPGMIEDGMSQRLIASGDLDQRALDAARAHIPLGRFGTASDVAEAVCFLASDRARFISGQKLDVDGGYGV